MTSISFRPASRREPCPVCTSTEESCSLTSNPDFVMCHGTTADVGEWKYSGESPNGFQAYFNRIDLNRYVNRSNQEWERIKAEREAKAEKVRQENLAKCGKGLNDEDRSSENRKFIGQLSLTDSHRSNLLNRGLNNEDINFWGFKSVYYGQPLSPSISPRLPGIDRSGKAVGIRDSGFLCPIYSASSLLLGFQVRADDPTKGKYKWLATQNSSHLTNGELPIGVYQKPGTSPQRIVLCEGFLKPAIAASLSGDIYIGAAGGNFAGSPQQLASTLKELLTRYPKTPICFAPDAGGLSNRSVRARDTRTLKLLTELDYTPEILWWNQGDDKSALDIDEYLYSSTSRPVTTISLDRYKNKIRTFDNADNFKRLNSCSYPAAINLNQADIGDLPLPEMGVITAVSSPCKTGKTTAISNWSKQHERQYPEGKVYLLGYRNALLIQTCQRMGIEHLHELQGVVGYGLDSQYINSQRGVGLCLDSLAKLNIEKITPNSLILLDEGEAVVKHLLEGGTMGGDHAKIAHYFRQFCQRVMELNGSITALEDNLTDLSLNFLDELCDKKHKIHFIKNTYKASHWDVTVLHGSAGGFVNLIMKKLVEGKRLFVPTTSQEFGEKLEIIIKERLPHLKVVRLDRKTMEGENTAEFCHSVMRNPDEILSEVKPDVFILSPTGESGVSIWADIFDEVVGYCVNLDARAQVQQLERCRLNKPRTIFVADRMASGETDIRKLEAKWSKSLFTTARLTGLDSEEFSAKLEESKFWNRHAAGFKARESISTASMRLNLTSLLKDRGHNVTTQAVEKSPEYSQALKSAKTKIDEQTAKDLYSAQPGDMTPEEARHTEKDPAARPELRLAARKVLLQERVPGVELTEDFILKAFVQNRSALLKSTEEWWYGTNPEIATALDWKSINAAQKDPIIFGNRFRHLKQKADLVEKLNGLRQLIEADGEYREGDDLVTGIANAAYANREECYRLFGYHIGDPNSGNKSHTPIATVNKFCKRFGLNPVVIRKEGARGSQIRIWGFSVENKEYRTQILDALSLKYSSLIEEVETQKASQLESQKAALEVVVEKESTLETVVEKEVASPSNTESTKSGGWVGRVGHIAESVPRSSGAWPFKGQKASVIGVPIILKCQEKVLAWSIPCRLDSGIEVFVPLESFVF